MILTPALAAQIRSDQFRRLIHDARTVEVKASECVPPDNIYAMDVTPSLRMPDWMSDWWPDDDRGKVLVICAPQHREFCESVVAQIRTSVDLESLMALFKLREPTP